MQQIHFQVCAASFTNAMSSTRAERKNRNPSDVANNFCITLITFTKLMVYCSYDFMKEAKVSLLSWTYLLVIKRKFHFSLHDSHFLVFTVNSICTVCSFLHFSHYENLGTPQLHLIIFFSLNSTVYLEIELYCWHFRLYDMKKISSCSNLHDLKEISKFRSFSWRCFSFDFGRYFRNS